MESINAKYRSVFQGPDGEAVLDDICMRGGMFSACENDEQRVRENFAKEIFALAAAGEDGTVKRQRYIDVHKRLTEKKETADYADCADGKNKTEKTNRRMLWTGLRKLSAVLLRLIKRI
jgi:predicted NodU family carbamoyl transferase